MHECITRIEVKAKMLTDLEKIRGHMTTYPGLSLSQNATEMVGNIKDRNSKDRYYVVAFTKDRVIIEMHSDRYVNYFMRELLLRFASIAALLSNDYEFDISGIFPYIVEVLGEKQLDHYQQKATQKQGMHVEDILLAKKINSLMVERSELTKTIEDIRAALNKVFLEFIILKYPHGTDIDALSNDAGLSREMAETMLNKADLIGYKIVRIDKKFGIVKA